MSGPPAHEQAHVCKPTICQFKEFELDLPYLSRLSEEKFSKKPFGWQLEAASASLQGRDLILDVGTGNGKTLVFNLPLLLDPKDISITVSPLSALMIDQVYSMDSVFHAPSN